jgi:hypothetical protein
LRERNKQTDRERERKKERERERERGKREELAEVRMCKAVSRITNESLKTDS